MANMRNYEDMTREELIRELQLMSLRRQVTPHFLFNSLSVAMSLVMQSPQLAVKFLRHMASLYRYLLRYGNHYHVPVELDLVMMMRYHELMSIRHGNNILLAIDPEVAKLKGNPVPPLSMQGLLENAIRHNVHTKESPLNVRLYIEDGFLCMSNNMVPLLVKLDSTNIGLKYISESMNLLYGRDINVYNDGNTFTVKLPLIHPSTNYIQLHS